MIRPVELPAPGARVGFVYGPGEFPADCAGVVLAHVTDRWGTHAVVLLDAGTTTTVHSITERGIGCHILTRGQQ
jgi:hypothetical protein